MHGHHRSARHRSAADRRPLQIPLARVERVVELLDAGNTVPSSPAIARTRRAGWTRSRSAQIQQRLGKLRLLAERKQTILRSIESQGKLTAELAAEIEAAESTKRLEDLYLPFKPKKQTLATVARERGLEPWPKKCSRPRRRRRSRRACGRFRQPDRGVASAADALLGVGHILAEVFSERADLRQRLRKIVTRSGKLVSARAEPDDKKAQGFRDYFEYTEQLDRVPPHRVLAINRGEKAKVLRVKVEADLEAMQQAGRRAAGAARASACRILARLRPRRAGAAGLSQPGARSPPRDDRLGRSPRRGSLRPQLAQPAACSRRFAAAACWRSIRASRAAASWRRSTSLATCWSMRVIHLIGKAERRQEGRGQDRRTDRARIN